MTTYNTRIAPSPTGYFHLGTARTAYFNYLIAKATGGRFILRIDDTDTDRNKDDYYKCIFDTFNWLNLKYDHLDYQSKRLDFYNTVAKKLVDKGRAIVLDNGAIALNYTTNLPTTWTDSIAGVMKITDDDLKNISNLILMKSDGMPTYNFASILDDIDMNVNWIIRGVDHIKNTPKQIAIINAVSDILRTFDIKFTHVGLIHHNVDGKSKKMSKRDGAMGVLDYKDSGYISDALLNHILKLGWGHSDPLFDKKYKIITRQDAVDLINFGKFRSIAASHDIKKLDSINKEWLKINAPIV